MFLSKISQDLRTLDRKIHILRYVAGDLSNFISVQLRHHYTDYVAVSIQQWTARIARLDWCTDLQIVWVVRHRLEKMVFTIVAFSSGCQRN